MRKSKEFLGILLSVLICVFLIYVFVYATTTVGDDITIGADLTVTSGARIGTGTTPGHITALAGDSLLIEGELEVDGTAFFDGTVSLSDSGILYTTDIIGGRDTGLYLRIGYEALTSHSLAADDDMLVAGKLEVDGTAHFDGTVSVSDANGILMGDGATFMTGATSQSAVCVIGSLYVNSALGDISICDAAGNWTPIATQ